MDLFKLLGTISIDNSDANKALDDTSNKGQKTESKLKKAFTGIGKGALAVGKTVGAGLAVGATAVAGLTAKALSAVGELEQNMGGSEAVFGEHAAKMQETAKNAFSTMGLATSNYLATANKMGSLFKGAGFEAGQAADMTASAMQRAADVASIMGISTEAAMESIAGAAKGNFTMMDNLGVAMNDTTLNAYALEKGIGKTTQEMTNQEKIGLAMQMFMEKTADYAGNYSRENETLAGSLGTAKAALTNFLDGSGDVDQLITAFTGAVNSIVGSLETLAPRLVTGLVDIVNKLIPMIPPLLQKLLPIIIEGATSLINGIVAILPQLVELLTTTVIPQLLAALITIIDTLIQALPSIVESIVAALPSLITQLVDGLTLLIVSLCGMLGDIIQPLIDHLPEIIITVVDALMSNLPALIEGLISLVMGVVSATPQIVQALVDTMPTVIEMMVVGLLNALPLLISGYAQLATGVAKAAGSIWESVKQAFVNVFKGIWQGITKVFSDTGNWFGSTFQKAKDAVVSAFSNIKEKLSEPFTKARDKIKEVAEKIKGFFKGEISMPKIKMPKFAITPSGWKIGDLLEGVIPKLSIKWNAKGAIMKEPTIFGYNPATGTLQGGGEAGDEAVAPISTLQEYVKAAVSSENTVIVTRLDRIIALLVQFFPDMLDALDFDMYLDGDRLVGGTVRKMDDALGKLAVQKGRGR